MDKSGSRLICAIALVLVSCGHTHSEQSIDRKINAFLSLVGSCAAYIETGSLDAFAKLRQVPIEPEECALDCTFGSAKYVSANAPNAGYLRVLTPDPYSSEVASRKGVTAMPQSTRCLIKPADDLGRTPGSELNRAVQKTRQAALEAGRILQSDRGHYWNDGCGYNGLTYEVETISIGVFNSDQKILHFVQFHFPGLYYDGPTDLHGNPLGRSRTKTCEEVGF